MAGITLVGMGPGPLDWMTVEAERTLRQAARIFFRTSAYPAYSWLQGLGKQLVCFDRLYELPWSDSADLYDLMAAAVLKEASLRGEAVYVVPGSLSVLEDAARDLRRRAAAEGIEVRLVHGMSFLEPALSAVNHSGSGLQIVLPRTHVEPGHFSPHVPLLVCQIEGRGSPDEPPMVEQTMVWLLRHYPADHAVSLVWTTGLPGYENHVKIVPLAGLARADTPDRTYLSLYVPALPD